MLNVDIAMSPTSATSTSFFQASRAPVAIARETEDYGRRTHEGYRGMCSDPVHPGEEVRGCSVGCILGMSEVSPFVFIVAADKNMGFYKKLKNVSCEYDRLNG